MLHFCSIRINYLYSSSVILLFKSYPYYNPQNVIDTDAEVRKRNFINNKKQKATWKTILQHTEVMWYDSKTPAYFPEFTQIC